MIRCLFYSDDHWVQVKSHRDKGHHFKWREYLIFRQVVKQELWWQKGYRSLDWVRLDLFWNLFCLLRCLSSMLSLLQDRVLMALCVSLLLFSLGQSLYSSSSVVNKTVVSYSWIRRDMLPVLTTYSKKDHKKQLTISESSSSWILLTCVSSSSYR